MQRLVMVYNADAGLVNAALDTLHKTFSPSTYDCNLCAITYGAVSMKAEWRRFIDSLDLPVEFLHRDEFRDDTANPGLSLPAVLIEDDDGQRTVLLAASDINRARSVEDLTTLIENALAGRESP